MDNADNFEEICSWVRLALTQGAGMKIIYQALASYKNPAETCRFLEKHCPKAKVPSLDEAKKHADKHLRHGYRIVTPSNGFTPKLSELTDYPLVLYLSGKGAFEDMPSVAMVGSRRATPYGLHMAETLSQELAKQYICVISGLARGIDTSAHRGAVKANGITWAVLGCGIDICYPRENKKLRAKIEEKGLVISEYPMGTEPVAWNFPKRNRLIAALSLGTVVVQAPFKSGAMITANIAANLGREVMAVPGEAGLEQSEGCLELISEGAALIRNADDIRVALGIICEPSPNHEHTDDALCQFSQDEKNILRFIPPKGACIDDISAHFSISPGLAAALLVQLEMRGAVRKVAGSLWIRT